MKSGDRAQSPAVTEPGEDVALDDIPLHSTNLFTVLGENAVIQYESPSIECLFGLDQGELVGEPVAEYFHLDDRAAVVEAFDAVVADDAGTVTSVEYRHRTADGTYCWVESVTSADSISEGQYVINTRDISEQKARERELRRRNEALDRFAQLLSHDLRNPLQVARGRLDLVRETDDSEHLTAIERAHDRMETLIEELLTVARDGATTVETERVELHAAVVDCWRTVATRRSRPKPSKRSVLTAPDSSSCWRTSSGTRSNTATPT